MDDLKCLYTKRGILSGPLLVYLIRDWKLEGKCCVKPWAATLAEICHQGSAQVNLGQDDLR